MRGSRTLLIAVGAIASAGLLLELAASAAGFTLTQSGSTSGSTVGTSSTTEPVASGSDINAALAALAGGGAKTFAGPGAFRAAVNAESRIFEVLAGMGPNIACLTVRNLAGGEIRVSPNSSASFDVRAGETRAACVGPASAIVLSCRDGVGCEGVWRIDRL
jgi:hypothetical protein